MNKTKDQILSEVISKTKDIGPDFGRDEADSLVIMLWLGKLCEAGFINSPPIITSKGFDLASDLISAGWKVDTAAVISTISFFTDDEIELVSYLVMEAQNTGIAAMLEKANSLNSQDGNTN